MPSLLLDRAPHDTIQEPGRRPRRRLPLVRLAVTGVVLAVLIPVAGRVADWVSGWGEPPQQEVVDRSTPALLLALDDLSEFHALTGTFQVVIDQERDTPWVPSVISGERTRFLATGSVDAYIDFSGLDDQRVEVSGDRVTLTLPAPQLDDARIDPDNSRVLDRDRGVVERVGSMLGDGGSGDGELYGLAERKISAAAAASDLRERAEQNTRDMLTGLVRSLGYQQVTVEFDHTS
jgi:hypothetical protein